MREIDGLAIHQRASANDAGYAGLSAGLRCGRRHAPLAKGAVEPDTLDVAGGGLAHDLLRDVGVRGDDESIQIAGNAGKVGIALYAFDFGSVWVDGKHFVTGVAEFAEHGVCCGISPARDTSDSNTFSAQKIRNERRQLTHGHHLSQIQPHATLHSKHANWKALGDRRSPILVS